MTAAWPPSARDDPSVWCLRRPPVRTDGSTTTCGCDGDLAHATRHAPAHDARDLPSPEQCRERLTADLADWERDGLGYAAVVDRASGDVIGWAGLRHKDSDHEHLNLYYRLAHDRLGAGLGREISRAVVAWAVEHRPDALVTAMVDKVNAASLRTAASADWCRWARGR